MIRRVFIEQKDAFNAKGLMSDIRASLSISTLKNMRILQRYDIEGVEPEKFEEIKYTIFCEAPVENIYEETFPFEANDKIFGIEYLPGQFDQRADSAEQCIQILTLHRPKVACARIFVLSGVSDAEAEKIKSYLINAVDSRPAELSKPDTLIKKAKNPADVAIIDGFISMTEAEVSNLHANMSLAMSVADLAFCQDYFKNQEKRNPSITEIKLLDTYWSDHCRHTTFLTKLESVEFEESTLTQNLQKTWNDYLQSRKVLGLDKRGKEICLMDIALIGARLLKKQGKLNDIEDSEEINAASIVVEADIDGKKQDWLVMFKNETHNHPTEIEPFGGAATCLGGAIRDPLSGRSYVYQAMRVTGAADPRTPFENTLQGKLPQKKIVTGAAHGYSSYGNQIGLATGQVTEIYNAGYVAKRMEIGAVVAAAPKDTVKRLRPENSDVILLLGGRTGRDGIGGATGSSKDHTETALDNSAEVQKGDAPMERKLQRLFRNPLVSKMIKRCNDFGAGGVSVAIGELAPSLEINLDAVPKKYDGLDGTELAISESQERMAVVLDKSDAEKFIEYAKEENLECTLVAVVTDTGRLVMKWRGKEIVNLSREFLDTNGTTAKASAKVLSPSTQNPFAKSGKENSEKNWFDTISDLNCCSQRGLVEMFDSTIGAATVLHPYGGAKMATPPEAMCAKLPVLGAKTNTATLFSFGFNPEISIWSPYHGAMLAVLESVAKIIASGGELSRIRLTFQEYFEKLRNAPERWGKPLAALLGGLEAQLNLGTAAIGGKDSMSGSFKDLDVPPTLVSFAIAPTDANIVISPEFKKANSNVALLEIVLDKSTFCPDWDKVKALYNAVTEGIKAGKILSAAVVKMGGIAEAISKMSFGNDIGFSFEQNCDADLFKLMPASLIFELADNAKPEDFGAMLLGKTTAEKTISAKGVSIKIQDLCNAWNNTLEGIFPTKADEQSGEVFSQAYDAKNINISATKYAKPLVFIPAFPGTNCEYDTARAFEEAGAKTDIFVFRNASDTDVQYSINEMSKRIANAQILALPGGFSAGDEPAGSGKFISAVFRNPKLSEEVMRLLKDRKGLILGICNGFQALIKLGLVPFGEIRKQDSESPTLYYNNIARHISCYSKTKLVSTLSPWFADCKLNDEHLVAFSHGEGKFTAPESVIKELFKNGQIATQYVDGSGLPTAKLPYNPNGSLHAVEGITSPCGLVLGKMGHSERFGTNVGKNIPMQKYQPIFTSGVKYFR